MADNLLGLVHKIVQEDPDPIPEWYSQEFKNLVITMLLKNSEDRPTTSNILDMSITKRYMEEFLLSKQLIIKDLSKFEARAEATAHAHKPELPIKAKEEVLLTPKQKLAKKKEEEARKKFEMLSVAAKNAGQNMVVYRIYNN